MLENDSLKQGGVYQSVKAGSGIVFRPDEYKQKTYEFVVMEADDRKFVINFPAKTNMLVLDYCQLPHYSANICVQALLNHHVVWLEYLDEIEFLYCWKPLSSIIDK